MARFLVSAADRPALSQPACLSLVIRPGHDSLPDRARFRSALGPQVAVSPAAFHPFRDRGPGARADDALHAALRRLPWRDTNRATHDRRRKPGEIRASAAEWHDDRSSTLPTSRATFIGLMAASASRTGRHLFFNIPEAAAGRQFVRASVPRDDDRRAMGEVRGRGQRPRCCASRQITLNIGFTFLACARSTCRPARFACCPTSSSTVWAAAPTSSATSGAARQSDWDPVWRSHLDDSAQPVHVWVSLNVGANPDGTPLPTSRIGQRWLEGLVAKSKAA